MAAGLLRHSMLIQALSMCSSSSAVADAITHGSPKLQNAEYAVADVVTSCHYIATGVVTDLACILLLLWHQEASMGQIQEGGVSYSCELNTFAAALKTTWP